MKINYHYDEDLEQIKRMHKFYYKAWMLFLFYATPTNWFSTYSNQNFEAEMSCSRPYEER